MTEPSHTAGDRAAADRGAVSLRDFLTDGALAGMCAELSMLTGIPVEVRDEGDRVIVADGGAWRALPPGSGLDETAIGASFPLLVGGETIGRIVVGRDGPAPPHDGRERLERALALIARTSSELCENAAELRHALDELGVLFELAALLVDSADVRSMVDTALASALRVFRLDAGSVVLLKEDADGIVSEDERDLVLTASRGLSRWWLDSPESLSEGRVFDRLALAGEVVAVEDLLLDPRVRIPDRVRTEGLRAFICAGLVFRGRPIGVMRLYARSPRSFDELDKRLLRSIAQQAAAAVQQSRLIRQRQRQRQLDRQLALAADVQRRLLPRRLPRPTGLDLAAGYQPSFEVAGDFYDAFESHGGLGLLVGDVVGKGIPAALLMASVRASLRAHAERTPEVHRVLEAVNRDLCRDTLPSEFTTLWLGRLDPATLRLTYACAGHEPPFVVRAGRGATTQELDVGGIVAGVDAAAEYRAAEMTLRPGDVLVAYTDGACDVMDFESRKFGKRRLQQAVRSAITEDPSAKAGAILERVFRELRQFAGLAARPDDVTVLVVRVEG